ncbi:MAG TPA: sigma-70 family RNA polymerase sigma factor [Elusimicrobiota bacterium]|nr:sigma-70 family RNA polymerase sigma factor [Elusimicrobiota bacterium]
MPEYSAEREPDESLMRQFQAGDGEAFDALFDRYSARLINFAFRFLHSREEAEDAAQDVFLRLRGKKERYDPSRPFRPWLFSIASRLVSNRLRQKKRHPLLSIFNREDDEGESPVLIDPADPPDERPEQTAAAD